MKKINCLNKALKTGAFIFFVILCSVSVSAQSDTLHLNYVALQPKMPDSTEAKITNWVKKLNGKHMDVQILAYYSQADFKKYSVERSEDVNLIVLRKARDLVTITKNEVKKGAKSQRSLVDIIYKPTGSVDAPKEKAVAKKEEKTETTTTTNTTKTSTSSTEKKEETSSSSNNETAPAQPVVKDGYYLDSVYVNGVLKVTKRKIKKK